MGKDEVKTLSDDENIEDTDKKNEIEFTNANTNDSNKSEKNQNTDEIRKIIKFKPSEEKEESKDIKKNTDIKKFGSPKTDENTNLKTEKNDDESKSRESLEQKRAVLQSIKDFDFQIKKNQEDITGINQKLEAFSKDLDDLVSLYEIVSEQMNPFVGLSKITKKKLDSLETFIQELETMRGKLGDIEAFAESAGMKIDKSKPGSNGLNTNGLSDKDLDIILERSFEALLVDEKIDRAIDEFIINLNNENVNN
jgi:flagellar protein FlaC